MLASTKTEKTLVSSNPRLKTHVAMAGVTVVGCIIAAIMAAPGQELLETITIGTGYVGLLLIAATLLIGPINMIRVRKNPVNIMLRRDVGIWAAITAIGHVLFSVILQLSWDSNIWGLFLNTDGSFKFNLFGVSNVFGLIGAMVILFLLVLSNNYFLKMLKGKNWKSMQLLNYLLFGLTLVHTFTQQANNGRGAFLIFAVIGITAAVVIGQTIGALIYQQREQARQATKNAGAAQKAAPATKVNPYAPQANVYNRQAPVYNMNAARRMPAQMPRYDRNYRAVAEEEGPSFLKVAMFLGAAVLSLFGGFMLAKKGSEFINANASNDYSNYGSYSSGSSNNSQSSPSYNSGTRVNPPSFSQPPVRSRHS